MSKAIKGIVLAGGSGTRLYPLTQVTSKQLLPVYDKPMIYYPICTLMAAGIREILIITTPQDQVLFERLLGDGQQWGLQFQFAAQPNPGGLAQAFLIGREFIGEDHCCLILGDNIFYGESVETLMQQAISREHGASVFGYWVKDPQRYGVAEFDTNGQVIGLFEKPEKPKSNYAITGLYVYDNQVVDLVSQLAPSARGELEITDLNSSYLQRGLLHVECFDRGVAWLDTGTHESLMQASSFIETIEQRQGLKIGCPEEIAYSRGWIDAQMVMARAQLMAKSGYGDALLKLLEQDSFPKV